MKKTIRLSVALLPPSLRHRFTTLLNVAGKRSIAAWQITDHASAEVLLMESASHPADQRLAILVSDDPAKGVDGRSLRVPVDFRVANLMDVLDLAAVRALAAREVPSVQTPTAKPEMLYQLKHWVFLSDAFSSPAFVRVLAAMSRKAVSRAWMESKGGLQIAQVDSLLRELNVLGALILKLSTPQAPETIEAPSNGGFVSRLRRWIGGARRQTALQN